RRSRRRPDRGDGRAALAGSRGDRPVAPPGAGLQAVRAGATLRAAGRAVLDRVGRADRDAEAEAPRHPRPARRRGPRDVRRVSAPSVPLTLAGSDPTGGAGLEADLKTFLAHGRSGAAVATALTTQDTTGVFAVAAEPVDRLASRLDVLLRDVDVAGLKI